MEGEVNLTVEPAADQAPEDQAPVTQIVDTADTSATVETALAAGEAKGLSEGLQEQLAALHDALAAHSGNDEQERAGIMARIDELEARVDALAAFAIEEEMDQPAPETLVPAVELPTVEAPKTRKWFEAWRDR